MKTNRGDMPASAGGHKVMKRVNQSDPGSNYAQMAYTEPRYKGMTIREQFAMAMAQGFVSTSSTYDLDKETIAVMAVDQADALLAELERTQ